MRKESNLLYKSIAIDMKSTLIHPQIVTFWRESAPDPCPRMRKFTAWSNLLRQYLSWDHGSANIPSRTSLLDFIVLSDLDGHWMSCKRSWQCDCSLHGAAIAFKTGACIVAGHMGWLIVVRMKRASLNQIEACAILMLHICT